MFILIEWKKFYIKERNVKVRPIFRSCFLKDFKEKFIEWGEQDLWHCFFLKSMQVIALLVVPVRKKDQFDLRSLIITNTRRANLFLA